jgi:chemotaxis protein MotA
VRLPALGIVACVLGVVKTMGAIDQPPAVLGGLIGGALVGTFLGVFLAYGFVEPYGLSVWHRSLNDEGEIFKVVKQIIIGHFARSPHAA